VIITDDIHLAARNGEIAQLSCLARCVLADAIFSQGKTRVIIETIKLLKVSQSAGSVPLMVHR
jgi:hypothetical protein